MMADNFNKDQLLAINTFDKDILVSAGAGSGKTSVMIERIAKNIIENDVNVNDMLVVTFTNAAANEMRLKLEKKLFDVLKTTTDEGVKKRLREQIDMLGQSDISTLHKFCISVIQKYFYIIDVDPSFAVGDESETALIRARALNDVVRECVKNNDANFRLIASTFDSKRNFDKIKQNIYKIHIFLTNLPDINEYKNRINKAYSGGIDDNDFAKILNNYILEIFEHYSLLFSDLKNDATILGYTDLVAYLNEIIPILNNITPAKSFSKNTFAVFNLPQFPQLRIKTTSPEQDDLKDKTGKVKESFSNTLKQLREKLITDDLEKLENDLLDTKKIIDAMFYLVEKFEARYGALKKERNIYDFSDLEHFAYKILCDDTVCAEIKNRYKQIYVDEYQDINDIQEGIIARVHTERDLFLVGDVKQSIYGFRNTNPQIFLDKLNDFDNLNNDENCAIRLNFNYRTDQKILNLVNFVFGKLMTKHLGGIDYLPSNKMESDIEFKMPKNSLPEIEFNIINKPSNEKEREEVSGVYQVSTAPIIESVERDYAHSEGVKIAEKIAEFMTKQRVIYDAKNKTFRDIKYSDITLLCSTRSDDVYTILDTIREYGIPVGILNKDDIFNEYEIQVLFAYLNLVNNPFNDIYLTTLLASPIINLSENDLARVRACAPERDNYYECVLDYLNRDDEIAKKLNYCFELINNGVDYLLNDNIYNLLNYFCEQTQYLVLISSLENGTNRVKNMIGYINSFTGKKYNNNLRDYLSSVEQAENTPKVTPENSIGDDAINIETMHKSKGLEYPIVFLINTGHRFNDENRKGDFILHNTLGIGTNKYDVETRTQVPTLSLNAIKIAMRDKEFAESLRLLYVAMTRAKNHLIITGCADVENLKSSITTFAIKSNNNFLQILLSALNKDEITSLSSGITELKLPVSENNSLKISVFEHIDYNTEKQSNIIKKHDFDSINAKMSEILANFGDYTYKFDNSTHLALKNSVTALNRESESEGESVNPEPKQFLITENNTSSVSTLQGIAYHKAMQLIDFDLPDAESIRLFLLNKMTPSELELIDTNKIFSAIQNIRPLLDNARILREQQFMMRKPYYKLVGSGDNQDEILVQGIIDLVIIRNNEVILVDYKTSASHNIEKTAQNYITQLNCYAQAIEGALGVLPTKKFLYFFLQERLILIDN